MAQTESKRELILQNLKTTLTAINGVDPYWTDVQSVKRVASAPTEFEGEEKPGILILSTGEPEEVENQHAYHDRRTLKIGIIGILDKTSSDEGTSINRFMKDVARDVMADVTRGGNATQTFVTRRLDVSNLFGDLGIFEMELSIIYHCDAREE